MKTFRFHWPDGKVDEGKGDTVGEAFYKLGFEFSAIFTLDYWKEIKEEKANGKDR